MALRAIREQSITRDHNRKSVEFSSTNGTGGLIEMTDTEDGIDVEFYRVDPTVKVTIPAENGKVAELRFYAVKVETDNTTSGNPRRGWLVYDAAGHLAGFADEGYRGNGALHNAAAILAGHELAEHEQGGETDAGYDGQGGSIATGPAGTVRITPLAVLSVPAREYNTARKHGTARDPFGRDSGTRQF